MVQRRGCGATADLNNCCGLAGMDFNKSISLRETAGTTR